MLPHYYLCARMANSLMLVQAITVRECVRKPDEQCPDAAAQARLVDLQFTCSLVRQSRRRINRMPLTGDTRRSPVARSNDHSGYLAAAHATARILTSPDTTPAAIGGRASFSTFARTQLQQGIS